MRSLIRPALFMVARIGLVLSVVMWGVGQRMGVEASAKFANTRATYVFGDVGVVADVVVDGLVDTGCGTRWTVGPRTPSQ